MDGLYRTFFGVGDHDFPSTLFATDKWVKYNTWLMAGYMLAAGAIFLW